MTQVSSRPVESILRQELEWLGIVGAEILTPQGNVTTRYVVIEFQNQEDLNLFKISSDWGDVPLLTVRDDGWL